MTTGRRPIIARRHTTVTVLPWTIDDGPLKSNYCPVVCPVVPASFSMTRVGAESNVITLHAD